MDAAVTATVFFVSGDEFATLTNVFKVNGVPTDATVATLTITDPTGATTTPAVTHSGTGTYTANVACTIAGTWAYLWEGTGTAADAVAGTWGPVTDPALNRLYATPEELKSRLQITGIQDDLEIMIACQGASGSIEEITGRYFWRGTDTRTYVPDNLWRQAVDDLVSVTTLKVDQDGDGVYEQTWTSGTDYALEVAPGRYNTMSKGEAWPYTGFLAVNSGKLLPFVYPWRHLDSIQITGVFGWPAIPRNVKQAALIAAADLFKLKDAPFGVAGIGDLGILRVKDNPMISKLLARYMNGQRVGV